MWGRWSKQGESTTASSTTREANLRLQADCCRFHCAMQPVRTPEKRSPGGSTGPLAAGCGPAASAAGGAGMCCHSRMRMSYGSAFCSTSVGCTDRVTSSGEEAR